MVSITLSVPEETRKLMKQFPELNWSGFIKKSIIEKAKKLEELNNLKNQLEKESGLSTWAIKLQKKSRKGRILELKKKGLL